VNSRADLPPVGSRINRVFRRLADQVVLDHVCGYAEESPALLSGGALPERGTRSQCPDLPRSRLAVVFQRGGGAESNLLSRE
jgi:hypothetical protein